MPGLVPEHAVGGLQLRAEKAAVDAGHLDPDGRGVDRRRAPVDPAALGFTLSAFITVTTRSSSAGGRFRDAVNEMPQVIECHRLTGERSYLLRVVATSAEDLEDLIDALTVYGNPVTSIVLSSPISRRPIEPPQGDGQGRTTF